MPINGIISFRFGGRQSLDPSKCMMTQKWNRNIPAGLRLACLALLAAAGTMRAVDTNAVLSGWFAAQTNLHTWTADFVQSRSLKALTQPLVTPGHLAFAAPNQFRWELGRPARTIALRQNSEMFVIYPLLQRAEHYDLGGKTPGEWRDLLALLDAGMPRDHSDFDGRFRITSLAQTNSAWILALEPRSAFARKLIKEIRIGLSTNDFTLNCNELIFMDGSRMRNDFTNSVLNPKLDPGLFSWQPPTGFKVTEPLAK